MMFKGIKSKHGVIDAKMHILLKMKLLLHEILTNKVIINTPGQELYGQTM